ncbi:MAG: HIT family protein [Desulfovibrionaceae bacterium]|nr:HIT family protein [Desulfovibrionaceae bacterium]
MDDCIFCMITEGKLPSSKVFESDTLLAFLDLNPCQKGHTLLIPKKHCKDIFGVDPAIGADVLAAMKTIGQAIKDVTGCTGINVVQNNGRDAGQMVDHLHWHLIPRFAGDGLDLWPQGKYDSMDEMNAMAEKLRKVLG